MRSWLCLLSFVDFCIHGFDHWMIGTSIGEATSISPSIPLQVLSLDRVPSLQKSSVSNSFLVTAFVSVPLNASSHIYVKSIQNHNRMTPSDILSKQILSKAILCYRILGIFIVGGWQLAISNSMEYYFPHSPEQNHLLEQKMIECRHNHVSVLMADGRVLTAGGEDHGRVWPV